MSIKFHSNNNSHKDQHNLKVRYEQYQRWNLIFPWGIWFLIILAFGYFWSTDLEQGKFWSINLGVLVITLFSAIIELRKRRKILQEFKSNTIISHKATKQPKTHPRKASRFKRK